MLNTIKAQLGDKNPQRIEKEKNVQVNFTIGSDNIRRYSVSGNFNIYKTKY